MEYNAMINQPKLDKAHLIMLEELAKKYRRKPLVYLQELLSQMYNKL